MLLSGLSRKARQLLPLHSLQIDASIGHVHHGGVITVSDLAGHARCLLQERWFHDDRSAQLITILKQLPIFTAGSLRTSVNAHPSTTLQTGDDAMYAGKYPLRRCCSARTPMPTSKLHAILREMYSQITTWPGRASRCCLCPAWSNNLDHVRHQFDCMDTLSQCHMSWQAGTRKVQVQRMDWADLWICNSNGICRQPAPRTRCWTPASSWQTRQTRPSCW